MARENAKELEVIIVHGGTNQIMRARAAAVRTIQDSTSNKMKEKLHIQHDRVIIFSGGHTRGSDKPSEARKMYEVFMRRLIVLEESIKISGALQVPNYDQIKDKKWWKIKLEGETIFIGMEDEAVDTEDNAEKSMEMIRDFILDKSYTTIKIEPLSSDFHIKRIREAFHRHIHKLLAGTILMPLSAEKILESMGGKYRKYGLLKEKSIGRRTKLFELGLRLASFSRWGRARIRTKTNKRIQE